MKLTIDNINLLKDKKIITHVIPTDDIIKKYDTVESLKIAELITLTDPTELIENSIKGDTDYTSKYLTTKAVEDGTISFNIWYSMGTDMIRSISYSTDGGSTWVTTENQNDKSENLSISVSVKAGDEVLWKGDATQTGYYDEEEDAYTGSFFSGTGFDAYGNVMSLLYGNDFINKTSLSKTGSFARLFSDWNEEIATKIIDASNLILPATTLVYNCYDGMFGSCTSLTVTPTLPATTLADNCYRAMFSYCTSLTVAPALPATTLKDSCYNSMFYECTSLTTAPALPATTLTTGCYSSMFYGCTSLTTAPALPATTLAHSCYSNMFRNCTLLTTAPELPATTLADLCYENIFNNCTSLTTSPVLPATTLEDYCYADMFNGCNNLNYIECYAIANMDSACGGWVTGVAATGMFKRNSQSTDWERGNNGIPNGWIVDPPLEG